MPIQPTNETLAYIAGLFDGEGSFGLYQSGGHTHKYWDLRAFISNTNVPVLKFVQQFMGGKIRSMPRVNKQKIVHQLYWCSKEALAFAEAISPWLQIKKEQASIVSAWGIIKDLDKGKHGRPNEESLALLGAQMKWLNQRGDKGQIGSDPMTASLQKDWGVLIPEIYLAENFEFVGENDAAH